MEKNEKKYLKKSRAMRHVLESQLDTEQSEKAFFSVTKAQLISWPII